MTAAMREIELGRRYGRVADAFEEFLKIKNQHLEEFAAAFYLKAGSDVDPRDVMLVQRDNGRGVITFHFEKRTPTTREEIGET